MQPLTIKQYLEHFNTFDINQVDSDYIYQWLKEKRHHNSHGKAFLINIKDFVSYCDFTEEFQNFVASLRVPKVKPYKPFRDRNVLSLNEVDELACSFPNTRETLMTYLSFFGGLRISEVRSLTPLHFNWSEWQQDNSKPIECQVTGKGNKTRMFLIPPQVAGLLMQYINEGFSINHQPNERLFTQSKQRWQFQLSHQAMKVLGRKVNPHLLRHSCATYLLQKGTDLKTIQEYLGHADISTTALYLHMNPVGMKTNITKAFME